MKTNTANITSAAATLAELRVFAQLVRPGNYTVTFRRAEKIVGEWRTPSADAADAIRQTIANRSVRDDLGIIPGLGYDAVGMLIFD